MKPKLSDGEQQLLKEVQDCHRESERWLKPYREKCDYLYALYRSFQAFRDGYKASPPDRDTLLRDAQETWGSELFIPFAFSTVETILPRAISNRPKMLVLPASEDAITNVDNMRFMIDRQQAQIDYELGLEETAKSGFIYGLGIRKLWWKKQYVDDMRLKRVVEQEAGGPEWMPWRGGEKCVFDDWVAEDIDLADVFWDPFGYDMQTLRYLIHRTWRPSKYVWGKLSSGEWGTDAAQQLEEKDLEALATGGQRWDEAHRNRMESAGNVQVDARAGKLHEVWEYHDGSRVCTILDQAIPVQEGRNPYWHCQIPFSAFRPTTAGIKQLAGIGAIEPIEQLQREINTLRSQRRDNAALKLMQVFAFQDGAIDPADFKFFPGAAIPTDGEPRDLLYPLNIGDIPHSGYQEEVNLVGDIERTTGISDTVTGAEGQGAAQTATGVQLVQAAANVRIQKQTRRLEVETVARECRQAVALNQQKIVTARKFVAPAEPKPGEFSHGWEVRELGPAELAGDFEVQTEGGSTAPKNVPQMRQDAQLLLQMFAQNPQINQRALLVRALELSGFTHPEAYLQQEERIPPQALELIAHGLEQAGLMSQQDAEGLVAQAVEAAAQLEQQDAGGQQVAPGEPDAAPGELAA